MDYSRLSILKMQIFRRSLLQCHVISLLVKSRFDLCMKESTCHEMVIYLSQIFSTSSMLCLFFVCTFSLIFNMIFFHGRHQ